MGDFFMKYFTSLRRIEIKTLFTCNIYWKKLKKQRTLHFNGI